MADPDPISLLAQEIAALKEAVLALTMAINMSATRLGPPGFVPYTPHLTDNVPYVAPYVAPQVLPAVDPLHLDRWVMPPIVTCNAEGQGDGFDNMFGPRA